MKFIPQDQSQQRLLDTYIRNKDFGLFKETDVIVDELLALVYDKEDIFFNALPSAEAKFYAITLAALVIVNGMSEKVTREMLLSNAFMILSPAPNITLDMTPTHISVIGLIDRYYSNY